MQEWTFADEMRLKPINLIRAALELARSLAYPHLNVAYYMEDLNEMLHMAADRIPAAESSTVQAELLAKFLFDELGFRGNTENYNDPANSYMNEVIDRRVGIPITLSILYIYLARQLGLPVHGVGMPGHFIVMVDGYDEPTYLDPYHGGVVITQAECRELVRHTIGYTGPWRSEWLQPVKPLDILIRMLNNLRQVMLEREDWSMTTAVIEHLRILQPDNPQLWRDRGLLEYKQRRFYRALHYLEMYLQQAPNASDVTALRQTFDQELSHRAPQN